MKNSRKKKRHIAYLANDKRSKTLLDFHKSAREIMHLYGIGNNTCFASAEMKIYGHQLNEKPTLEYRVSVFTYGNAIVAATANNTSDVLKELKDKLKTELYKEAQADIEI